MIIEKELWYKNVFFSASEWNSYGICKKLFTVISGSVESMSKGIIWILYHLHVLFIQKI